MGGGDEIIKNAVTLRDYFPFADPPWFLAMTDGHKEIPLALNLCLFIMAAGILQGPLIGLAAISPTANWSKRHLMATSGQSPVSEAAVPH